MIGGYRVAGVRRKPLCHIVEVYLMTDIHARPAHRANSADALLGSILAIEATLRVVITRLSQSGSTGQEDKLIADLQRQVEALLREGQFTTTYGTGQQEIRDGLQDTVSAIFGDTGQI